MTAPILCAAGVALALVVLLLVWSLCAMAGQLDDREEMQGVRRS